MKQNGQNDRSLNWKFWGGSFWRGEGANISIFLYFVVCFVVFAFFSHLLHSLTHYNRRRRCSELVFALFSQLTSLVSSTPPANCHTKSISDLVLYMRCSIVRSNHFFTSDTMNTDDVNVTRNSRS